jgi:hypothetical protein
MPHSFDLYRTLGHRMVRQGWSEPRRLPYTLDVLRTLSDAQGEAGVEGAVAEIGVHRGRLFIGLQLLEQSRPAVAIDVFGDQHLNVDGSGFGDLRRFETNVRRWADWSPVVVEQQDSTRMTGDDVRRLARGPIRLFSVDGGHTAATVRTDLFTAEGSLVDGGIVILDDVFNDEWPGVAVGTFRYLEGDGTLVPFAIGFNKTYLTDSAHASRYREAIRRGHGRRRLTGHKTSEFHDHEVEVMWALPFTPLTVLRRNRAVRSAYHALLTTR